MDGFAGDRTRGVVLFPPATQLVVLDTEGDGGSDRIYLAERALANQGERLLPRLRSAGPSVRSSAHSATRSPAPTAVVRVAARMGGSSVPLTGMSAD